MAEEKTWITMSAVTVRDGKIPESQFATNATGLTAAEATAEAERRNAAERAAGNLDIEWFPAKDPMAVLKRMGLR